MHYTMLGWPCIGRVVVVTLGSAPVGPAASSCYSAVPDSAIIEAFMLKMSSASCRLIDIVLFYLCRLAM